MDNAFKNIEEYNPNKERKILIVIGHIIAEISLVIKNLAQSFLLCNLVLSYQKILD